MRIFGWAADNTGPGFYRLRVPFGELQHHGHQTEVDTTMPDWALEEADVIVGQRVCQQGATARWRRLANGVYGGANRPMLVFEVDDDLWDIDPANVPARSFFNLSGPEIMANLTECARLADVCTVSTEPLADVVRKVNPNVVVVPNQLPVSAFRPEPFNRSNALRIGWGGGASHQLDVEEMTYGLRTHFRRHREHRFVNMGTLFRSVAAAVDDRQLDSLPWTNDMHEHYSRVAQLDIGLAPLRPSVFNRSKSEIKFLEYAAAGIPTIASDVGPYSRAFLDTLGQAGVLMARDGASWGRTLAWLTNDPDRRRELGEQAYDYALSRSARNHWQNWYKVYSGSW